MPYHALLDRFTPRTQSITSSAFSGIDGPFLAIIPGSMLRFGLKGLSVRVLPVKSRTLGPVARLFVDSLRETVKPLARSAGR